MWSEENLKKAISIVTEEKLSIRVASEKYQILRSTHHDRIKSFHTEVKLCPKLGHFINTFSNEFEIKLVEHIKDLVDF